MGNIECCMELCDRRKKSANYCKECRHGLNDNEFVYCMSCIMLEPEPEPYEYQHLNIFKNVPSYESSPYSNWIT